MNASVILVVYNGITYLERCLRAVSREIGERDEVVAVDNGSTDGSGDLIRARWPQVGLIRNTANRGFAAACNQGARRARNEILVMLNQDTEVQPGWLEGLRGRLAADPGVGLVTSKVLRLDQAERIQSCGQEVHFSGLTFGRGFGEQGGAYSRVEDVGAVVGVSLGTRKEVWEALGGMDEFLGMYYEDTDLSWRAIRRGWRCGYAPDSVVGHEQVVRPSDLARAYTARNRYVLLFKNLSVLTLLLLLPGLVCAEGLDWGYACMGGRQALWAKWRGLGWLVRHFKAILAARREAGAVGRGGDLALLESCTHRLTPKVCDGGRAGKAVIRLCNGGLYLNYQAAILVLRVFNL